MTSAPAGRLWAMTTSLTEPRTAILEVPGAVLRYDVREPATESAAPPLFVIGSPMDASGFITLASHFRDRTVVTYDPRGVTRSEKTDPDRESTPEQHADDLHRIIGALGAGPVELFASSGGAVNALALVARHPGDVHTLVAHEPPAAQVVEDRDDALGAVMDIRATYERDGMGAGMVRFITLVGHKGLVPADFGAQAFPDPAAFGMPADDGSRNDPLLGQNLVTCTHHEHDFDALRAASTRIVVAVGAESEGELAHRGGLGVAQRLGSEPVTFPGGHAGFLGGEFGMTGEPDAFASTLRQVLDARR